MRGLVAVGSVPAGVDRVCAWHVPLRPTSRSDHSFREDCRDSGDVNEGQNVHRFLWDTVCPGSSRKASSQGMAFDEHIGNRDV